MKETTRNYTPKHPDLIYDVGLHKGEDAEFYLRKGFRVIGFEADPDLIECCGERLKYFLDNGQLTIVAGAIVDPNLIRAGQRTVRFYRNTDVSVWGTVSAEWAERNARLGTSTKVVEVDAINFTDAVKEHGVPHFMKIDIEGCDQFCLDALSGFEERPSYVSIESDKTSFENAQREIDLLVRLGYTSFQAVEQSRIPRFQSPPDPPREGKYVSHCFEGGSSGLFGSELEGKWKSRRGILRQYRLIHLVYLLAGDDGIISKKPFRRAGLLRRLKFRILGLFRLTQFPGWYDTHARHASEEAGNLSSVSRVRELILQDGTFQ
jgi:FkbM family methyltransferase